VPIRPSRCLEFNLSHTPNPLDTNKIKVVRVFDWARGNTVRSLVYNLLYVLATLGTRYTLLIAVVFCSLRKTMAG